MNNSTHEMVVFFELVFFKYAHIPIYLLKLRTILALYYHESNKTLNKFLEIIN